MRKNKKILITGANGQLGKCVFDTSSKYTNCNFIFKTSSELNITNNQSIKELFSKEKFDYCINCAAYTAVDKAEENEDKAFMVNAEGVKNLAEACAENDVVLLHISTDFVFDGKQNYPYREDDIPNPLSVYGISKLKGEEYIKQICSKYFIIRTSWVYSKYGNNFVKTMIRLGLERDEISVVDDQIGSPTYAGDLADFLLSIISTNSNTFGVYHFSNEGAISWYDFACEIIKQKKMKTKLLPITSNEYITLADRPKHSVLSFKKSKEAYDLKQFYWKYSLAKVIALISSK